jgi:hypothetical protein
LVTATHHESIDALGLVIPHTSVDDEERFRPIEALRDRVIGSNL